jgi:hypothetical protein
VTRAVTDSDSLSVIAGMATTNGRKASVIGAGQTVGTAALGLLDNGFDVNAKLGSAFDRCPVVRMISRVPLRHREVPCPNGIFARPGSSAPSTYYVAGARVLTMPAGLAT